MNLSDLILLNIKHCHRGKENAVCRKALLKFCQILLGDVTDREMRKAYSSLPIVTCEKGVFYPIRSEELEEFRLYLRAKALPMLKRWRTVANAHPDLISDDYSQMDLF